MWATLVLKSQLLFVDWAYLRTFDSSILFATKNAWFLFLCQINLFYFVLRKMVNESKLTHHLVVETKIIDFHRNLLIALRQGEFKIRRTIFSIFLMFHYTDNQMGPHFYLYEIHYKVLRRTSHFIFKYFYYWYSLTWMKKIPTTRGIVFFFLFDTNQ